MLLRATVAMDKRSSSCESTRRLAQCSQEANIEVDRAAARAEWRHVQAVQAHLYARTHGALGAHMLRTWLRLNIAQWCLAAASEVASKADVQEYIASCGPLSHCHWLVQAVLRAPPAARDEEFWAQQLAVYRLMIAVPQAQGRARAAACAQRRDVHATTPWDLDHQPRLMQRWLDHDRGVVYHAHSSISKAQCESLVAAIEGAKRDLRAELLAFMMRRLVDQNLAAIKARLWRPAGRLMQQQLRAHSEQMASCGAAA